MKPTKLSTLFCLSLVLGLSGISSPSEAKVAKAQKQAKHNKVKQVKQQRRTHRKAAPQRRLAALRLPSKAATKNKKVTKAIKEGKLSQLMTTKKGVRTLNFGKFSKASRLEITNALSKGPNGQYVIEFGNIPTSERAAIAEAAFQDPFAQLGEHPLTQAALKQATSATSFTVNPNGFAFGTGKNKVEYVNSLAGTVRTKISKGKRIVELATRNPTTNKWTINQPSVIKPGESLSWLE